ncbi:hypothetical protein E2C00_31260 [Streptomyces sp. WAC05374]|uniref:hypothetical protein n=1 Tax=Streptomyces sp. WAC05374 TaxID=2487420 RepID=UPI000F8859E1|nr:hypothetical protein [Streptomyces sp. WAC05374]RST18329.1 hypothetical protein EF905_05765 [Streptomyces sp. WAC05374]TDF39100.1 hypothetical protein E2B92_26665 [Streptomyces sp. WAC05374]TDF47477.1 hypothetical protein E2C02_30495 [Streptomyces sp. WAC05374]TDF48208.1 hypothetical protein E2C00_31260 [Streptomyces sp. WAC05374]
MDQSGRHDDRAPQAAHAPGAAGPDGVVALARTAARTTDTLAASLQDDWALYTPGQAAAVAAELFAQAASVARALHGLAGVLTAMTGPDGPARADDHRAGAGDPARAYDAGRYDAAYDANRYDARADAVRHLATAAEELAYTLRHAPPATAALRDAPPAPVLPLNAHETLAGVAALLGEDAVLNQRHRPGDYVIVGESPDGYGCGCDVDFRHAGEEWNFHRSDSAWSLVRVSDGIPAADGTLAYTRFTDLTVTDETAHPAHVAAQIGAALSRLVREPVQGGWREPEPPPARR